jgi:hypothetical protein
VVLLAEAALAEAPVQLVKLQMAPVAQQDIMLAQVEMLHGSLQVISEDKQDNYYDRHYSKHIKL